MLTPSLSRSGKIAIGLGYGFFFLYLVIVMNQILLGLAIPAVLLALAYVSWRLWRVFRMHEQRLEAETESSEVQSETTAIDELKTRYATGELTEDEFEAELERLLEAESLADSSDELRSSEAERSE